MQNVARRYGVFAGALLGTSGRAALRRAMPLFGGIAALAAVLFGPTGVRPAEVLATMHASPLARATLWVAWIVASVPLVRTLCGARSAALLRALPVPRPWAIATLSILAAGIQAPWVLLLTAGAGPAAGLAGGLAAASLGALLSVRPLRRSEAATLALLGIVVMVGSSWLLVVVGAATLPRAVGGAWGRAYDEAAMRSAQESAHETPPSIPSSPPSVALGLAYALRALRVERWVLARALALVSFAGALAALAARNNLVTSPRDWMNLAALADATALSLSGTVLAGPLLRAAASLDRIERSCGVTRATAARGRMLAGAGLGALLGGALAFSAALLGRVSPALLARTLCVSALWGAALGVLTLEAARWAEVRGALHKRDPGGLQVALALGIGAASLALERTRALEDVGWVPDAMDLPEQLTVSELTRLVATLKCAAPPEPAIARRLGVADLLGERLRALSLGQRRRASLYAALTGDPRLLLLDEPTNGLDPGGLDMLEDLLVERARRGKGALLATHDGAFAEAVATTTLAVTGGKAALAAHRA